MRDISALEDALENIERRKKMQGECLHRRTVEADLEIQVGEVSVDIEIQVCQDCEKVLSLR